jgi:hypothetical protein
MSPATSSKRGTKGRRPALGVRLRSAPEWPRKVVFATPGGDHRHVVDSRDPSDRRDRPNEHLGREFAFDIGATVHPVKAGRDDERRWVVGIESSGEPIE